MQPANAKRMRSQENFCATDQCDGRNHARGHMGQGRRPREAELVLTIALGQTAPLLEQDDIATRATCNGNLPRRGRGGGDGPVEGSLVGLAL